MALESSFGDLPIIDHPIIMDCNSIIENARIVWGITSGRITYPDGSLYPQEKEDAAKKVYRTYNEKQRRSAEIILEQYDSITQKSSGSGYNLTLQFIDAAQRICEKWNPKYVPKPGEILAIFAISEAYGVLERVLLFGENENSPDIINDYHVSYKWHIDARGIVEWEEERADAELGRKVRNRLKEMNDLRKLELNNSVHQVNYEEWFEKFLAKKNKTGKSAHQAAHIVWAELNRHPPQEDNFFPKSETFYKKMLSMWKQRCGKMEK